MDMLADKETTILSKEGVSQYTGRPLLKKMAKLDTNTGNTATQSDIEGALKFLVGTDADTDNLIDETMEVAACLIFNRHAPLCIACTLFRNPEKYAKLIEDGCEWALDFKNEKSMNALGTMFVGVDFHLHHAISAGPFGPVNLVRRRGIGRQRGYTNCNNKEKQPGRGKCLSSLTSQEPKQVVQP